MARSDWGTSWLSRSRARFGSAQKTEDEILRYKWRNVDTGKIRDNYKPSLVTWVDEKTNTAYVGSGSNRVDVASAHPANGEPYLSTHADRKWTNNLANLDTF